MIMLEQLIGNNILAYNYFKRLYGKDPQRCLNELLIFRNECKAVGADTHNHILAKNSAICHAMGSYLNKG